MVPLPPPPPVGGPPMVPCPECGKQLRGQQALGLHRLRKHGVRAEARAYVDGTCCPVCMREFHNRHRLVNYLERDGPRAARQRGEAGGWCLLKQRRLVGPLDPERVAELDEEEKARRKSAGSYDRLEHLPSFRRPGPVPPPVAPAAVPGGEPGPVGHRLDDPEVSSEGKSPAAIPKPRPRRQRRTSAGPDLERVPPGEPGPRASPASWAGCRLSCCTCSPAAAGQATCSRG